MAIREYTYFQHKGYVISNITGSMFTSAAYKSGNACNMTTILLVDDHHLVRQGIRSLLESQAGFSVIGEAANGTGVADMAERLKPDVLITDLMLPGLNGLEVTRQVLRRIPTTRVIILSIHASEGYVVQALSNGASGYVLKDSNATDLIFAIQEAMTGRHYLSPPLSERAIEAYLERAQSLEGQEPLTAREREVLYLAAQGFSNPEIASQLSISPRTAEVHRANVMRKLELHNQVDLIRYALRQGILPMEDYPNSFSNGDSKAKCPPTSDASSTTEKASGSTSRITARSSTSS